MALQKEIILNNGVIVNYHRIVSLNKITNINNLIEVASYTSKEKRQEEIEYYNSTELNKKMNVFIHTKYIEKEYDEKETIEDCYTYIKNIEEFSGAKDV